MSVDTNRYSVPFTLIGQSIEVRRRDEWLEMRHRGEVIATHPVLEGRHQVRIQPEHGLGPIARNARLRYSTGGRSTGAIPFDVEVRDQPSGRKRHSTCANSLTTDRAICVGARNEEFDGSVWTQARAPARRRHTRNDDLDRPYPPKSRRCSV